MDRAVSYLISNYNPKGNWIGWLMMASIIVEAWDLYSIAFVLIFIRDTFHPTPALLGLAAAGTQGGAVIGALLGGWLADRLGRRIVFLSTMGMFVILAFAQAFVPNLASLIIIRLLLGIPLGSDISSGYTYIMESLPRGEREVMGNRWQFMFAVGQVLALAIVAVFIIVDLPHDVIWRVTLGLGAVPAAIIFYLRHDLPETAIWLIRRGRFREAKQVTASMYGDHLDMLPDEDVDVPRPSPTAFLADIRKDPIRWRATLFGWIACFAQSGEFSTFAFCLPVLFVMVGVSGVLGTTLVTLALYIVAAISGWVGPLITPRIGQRDSASPAFQSYCSRSSLPPRRSIPATSGYCRLRPRRCCGATIGTRKTSSPFRRWSRGRNIAAPPPALPMCSSSCRPFCRSFCSRLCSRRSAKPTQRCSSRFSRWPVCWPRSSSCPRSMDTSTTDRQAAKRRIRERPLNGTCGALRPNRCVSLSSPSPARRRC